MTLPLEASADYEEKATSANIGSNEVEYNEDNIRIWTTWSIFVSVRACT